MNEWKNVFIKNEELRDVYNAIDNIEIRYWDDDFDGWVTTEKFLIGRSYQYQKKEKEPIDLIFETYFTKTQKFAYRVNVENGWHDTRRSNIELSALIHTEVSELVEAERKDPKAPSEHVPQYTAEQEELADIVIRCMDYAELNGINFSKCIIDKIKFNEGRGHRHGNKKY